MSDCGCEGSCPICQLGEVDDHRCDCCKTIFCPHCHGVVNLGSEAPTAGWQRCQCPPVSDRSLKSLNAQLEPLYAEIDQRISLGTIEFAVQIVGKLLEDAEAIRDAKVTRSGLPRKDIRICELIRSVHNALLKKQQEQQDDAAKALVDAARIDR